MLKLENINVYNFHNAVRASKFPMAVDVKELNAEITDTVIKLGNNPRGSAHDNFLHGILVSFDLTCSNKMWVEFERYHFADIVSSQSTMHRITRLGYTDCYNEYVTDAIKQEINRLIRKYNTDKTPENYLELLYNVPSGIELTAHVVTNYGQLKTMWNQRHDHRLQEWRDFCKEILKLKDFKELTGCGSND